MQYRAWSAVLALSLATCVFADEQAPKVDSGQSNPPAQAVSKGSRPHVRFGGFTLGAGYSHFSGPYPFYDYYAGPWAYGSPYFYDWLLFSPYIHPGFYTGFQQYPYMGEVKIQTVDKAAWVYLDGALAGRADKLKTMWLDPGAYDLEVRDGNRKFDQRIYVLSGKTLKLAAEMTTKDGRP